MRKARFLFLTIVFIFAFAHPVFSTERKVTSPFFYTFNTPGTLLEAGALSQSSSPYWWVNSGGYLKVSGGRGSTPVGNMSIVNPWRTLYALSNSADTDNGTHPQNIFRLISRQSWGDARQETYFVIKKDNLSASSNRNASNGLLLFNRYQDGDNLYYAGVRVDGSAIIKKKIKGTYYTMVETKGVYSGTYNRNSSPSLLPKNKWIGLRTETENIGNGMVEVRLYIDKGWQGKWALVAKAVDDGKKYGGGAFTGEGRVGIRTDFMDVEFENLRIRDI